MATGWHEKPHMRTSKTGKIFKAGKGPSSFINTLGLPVEYAKHFVGKITRAKKNMPPQNLSQ